MFFFNLKLNEQKMQKKQKTFVKNQVKIKEKKLKMYFYSLIDFSESFAIKYIWEGKRGEISDHTKIIAT